MKTCYLKKLEVGTVVFSLISAGSLFLYPPFEVNADTIDDVPGEVYYFSEDHDKNSSNYDFSDPYSVESASSGNTIGAFSITGDITESSSSGITTYIVNEDTDFSDGVEPRISFSYDFDVSTLETENTEYHICDDTSNTINDITLDNKINQGAIVVMTSLDGSSWTKAYEYTDAFADDNDFSDFYETSSIQLLTGCYYRIIIAYETECKTGDSTVAFFIPTEVYNYRKIAEVYEFYAITADTGNTVTMNTDPKIELGEKVNTGLDNGYSGKEAIDDKDPHFGWDLGSFVINGYTTTTFDNDGDYVFVKDLGDKVTLWFSLEQDINCLNGDSNLTISEDTDGYDQYFEVPETNFEKGTLIIQFTDYQNMKHDPMIYTDFLSANASTTADTRVQLFEEGDYEVTLDYEIKKGGLIPSYYNYKISFSFSIRNGNCMVYPFELTDNGYMGSELYDNALTSTGFMLDMAKSRYLNITVTRYEVVVRAEDGHIQLEERYNSVAYDGDEYTTEGVYVFEVTNQYTGGQPTKKTIYVGTDPYIVALATSGKTIDEINTLLDAGAEINEMGEIIVATPTPTPIIEERVETTETVAESELTMPSAGAMEESAIGSEDNTGIPMTGIIIAIVAAVAIVGVIVVVIILRRKNLNKKKVGSNDETK